jgi:hypothetical protein
VKRRLAGAGLLAAAAAVAVSPPHQTLASWTDGAHAHGSLTAGTVAPPTGLQCSAGYQADVTFFWTAPAGGLTITGYRWTLTGGVSGSGTLPATAASIDLPLSTFGTGTGSGTFTLAAEGPGTWTSTSALGTVGASGAPLSTTCSVP